MWAADIETTGLLDSMREQADPYLHNLGAINIQTGEEVLFEGWQKAELQAWLNEGHTLVMHNGLCFDQPALEFLGYDTSKIKIIDTLPLSWYLEPNRLIHGLDSYGKDFNIPKPKIDNWENLSQEEYNHRVMEDCKIQRALWKHQVAKLKELYGMKEGSYNRIVSFLMWKQKQQVMQQENRWKLDVEKARTLLVELESAISDKTSALREAMPKLEQTKTVNPPAKPFKMNGTLSAAGEKWHELCKSKGFPLSHTKPITTVTGYEDGNPASTVQIKDWLFSLGWQPETFNFVPAKEQGGKPRQIPQVNLKGGKVCPSILRLAKINSGVEHLAGLGILNHRKSVVKGMLGAQYKGEVTARCQGFTNTLRLQHRELVNLPSVRVQYGERIRGLLLARKGKVLLGSDLSSLEDRIKHHFQWPLDPAYVRSQMSSDFDPHLAICEAAGMLTKEQVIAHKAHEADYSVLRSAGKATNYACQYGAGVATISRAAGVDMVKAKQLHTGYWELNWSIKEIAANTKVKSTSFGRWQWNPISNFWYSLRTDKDRFSTLIQGSGAFVLDVWLLKMVKKAKERGLPFVLLGTFHDELILELDLGMEEVYEELVRDSLQEVNEMLKLNRDLDCGVDFGSNYSEIH